MNTNNIKDTIIALLNCYLVHSKLIQTENLIIVEDSAFLKIDSMSHTFHDQTLFLVDYLQVLWAILDMGIYFLFIMAEFYL